MTTINTVEDLKRLGPDTALRLAGGGFVRASVLTDAIKLGTGISVTGFLPAQTLHPRVVTEAEVEQVANVICEADPLGNYMSTYRDMARAALSALGFEVQG